MRVERTRDGANPPLAGFEDREDHRTPFASVKKFTTRVWVLNWNHDGNLVLLQVHFVL